MGLPIHKRQRCKKRLSRREQRGRSERRQESEVRKADCFKPESHGIRALQTGKA